MFVPDRDFAAAKELEPAVADAAVRAVKASGFEDGLLMIAVAPETDAVAARGVVLRSDRC